MGDTLLAVGKKCWKAMDLMEKVLGRASWTGHPKRVEALRFSKSLCNNLTVTMQPNILYLQIWCYFEAETCSYRYLLCESHEFRFKDIGDMSICFWRFTGGGGGGSGGGGSGLYKVDGEHCITLVKLESFYVTSPNTHYFGVILKFNI